MGGTVFFEIMSVLVVAEFSIKADEVESGTHSPFLNYKFCIVRKLKTFANAQFSFSVVESYAL